MWAPAEWPTRTIGRPVGFARFPWTPAVGQRGILHEGGKFDLGVEPVVRDDGGDAAGRECGADKAVFRPVAAAPAAAIEEESDRAGGLVLRRRIDIQFVAGLTAIGEGPFDRNAAVRHQHAVEAAGRRLGQKVGGRQRERTDREDQGNGR